MIMANTSLRPNTLEMGSGRITGHNEGQFPIVRNVANSPRPRQRDAGAQADDASRRSKVDHDTSEGDDTGSGPGSDSEEETIISDEIQEDNLGHLKAEIAVTDGPQLSMQDDGNSVPPALLGEIRKMIQAEFGAFRAITGSEQPKTGPRQSVDESLESPPSPKSSLRVDTETRSSPPAGSPRQNSARLSPDSPRARLARSVSMGATPTSPERQTLVRFAEEEKWAAAQRAQKPPSPTKSLPQLSPIDEKWGQLFDDRGQATKRLEQVLKGMANYIIDQFMPQKSIVIPPDKMAALYSHHRVDSEAHPLSAIFRCRTKGWSVGLEDTYRDLGCEYYLIPKDMHSRPSIPSLTPSGFAKWMTCSILAYPDAEAKRLSHMVAELPIDADGVWDGISERLPKQISRHLFPDKPDRKARRLLDDVVRDFVEEFLPASPSKQTPTRQQPPRIEIISEGRPSASSTSAATSPRTTRYMPDPRPRSRANSTSSPQPPPMRLGRAYSDDPSRLSLVHHHHHHHNNNNNNNRKRDSEPTPLPSPLSRNNSGTGSRRRSSPTRLDPYRRSVGEMARANSPVPLSPGDEREREDEYQGYVPSRTDYMPKGIVAGERDRDRATPRRVAAQVVQDGVGVGVGVVNPGPTWDEYLSGRQSVPGRGHKASV